MRACGSSLTAQDESCIIIVCIKKSLSSSQPCHLFAGLYLIFSHPVRHNKEAPLGQHDLLQGDTVHRALPEPVQSSTANEPLSHVNYERGQKPAQHLSHKGRESTDCARGTRRRNNSRQVYGQTAQGASTAQVNAMSRNLKMGTVLDRNPSLRYFDSRVVFR